MTAYTFKVAAINGVGTGTQSAASTRSPRSRPGGAHHRHRQQGQQHISHGHLDGAGHQRRLGCHRLCRDPLHREHGPDGPDLQPTATTETVTGLTHGNTYTFKVAAINAEGTGTQSGASNSASI